MPICPVGRLLLVFFFLLFRIVAAEAQITDTLKSTGGIGKDTMPNDFVKKVQKLGRELSLKDNETIKANRIARRQGFLFSKIRKTALEAKLYLQRGIDTIAIARQLELTKSNQNLAKEGIFNSSGNMQFFRDLRVSSIILTELLVKMEHQRALLDNYTNNLLDFREQIDSLGSAPELVTFPNDSAMLVKYLTKMLLAAKDLSPTDSALKQSIASLQGLQTKVDLTVYELRADYEHVESYRKILSRTSLNRELPNLWEPTPASESFREILRISLKKDFLAVSYYVQDHAVLFVLLLVLILIATRFLSALKSNLQHHQKPQNLQNKLVTRYPLLSAIIIVTSVFQFIFPYPPFLVNFLFWGIPAICHAFVFNKYISAYWSKFWAIIVALFILASADNLLLRASHLERWFIFGLALTGFVFGLVQLISSRKNELREKKIIYFILFLVIMEAASLLFNIYGRYNLAKIIMTSGYFGLVIAILFLWTMRLINEALTIASELYQQPDKKLFFLNFDRVGEKVPSIFYVFLITGWFVLVARNFYIYRRLSAPFLLFISEPRTIGDYTFSIKGIFIFFTILACSVFLSRLISFFTTDDNSHKLLNEKSKLTIGSWLLLIRIVIISSGLFLAIVAAGIPLDRITIILGALGVGIGLGLQGLVSNLVSGLTLAFEKPVNVGDTIEINGTLGTMKSIGFRSSAIALVNGAVTVIPNNDILNNHLVNWSLGKKQVRTSIVVGVAYGTDLSKVHKLLTDLLKASTNILHDPAPLVIAKEFNQSSIDFEMFFWVKTMTDTFRVKSEVILAINRVFNEAGIVIPFPQRDLHIRQEKNGEEVGFSLKADE